MAVSKTKPSTAIEEAYNYGQRHFGENYVSCHFVTLSFLFAYSYVAFLLVT